MDRFAMWRSEMCGAHILCINYERVRSKMFFAGILTYIIKKSSDRFLSGAGFNPFTVQTRAGRFIDWRFVIPILCTDCLEPLP